MSPQSYLCASEIHVFDTLLDDFGTKPVGIQETNLSMIVCVILIIFILSKRIL